MPPRWSASRGPAASAGPSRPAARGASAGAAAPPDRCPDPLGHVHTHRADARRSRAGTRIRRVRRAVRAGRRRAGAAAGRDARRSGGGVRAMSERRPRIRLVRVLVAWVLSAAALLFAALVVPGVAVEGWGGALVAAAIIAVLN